MDLRKDIEKTTTLPLENNDAKFYRLQGLSQAAKDKRMNERKVRKPPNLNVSTYVNAFIYVRSNI